MKRIAFFLIIFSGAMSAQTITLDSCIRWAKQNYPLIKQNQLLIDAEENNIRGYNKSWLPRLSFVSQATYQSEVTEFKIPGINFNIPKDDYANALNFEETFFDAGTIREQKRVEKLNTLSETERNEVELYKLAERISTLYGNILLARENINILNTFISDIDNKKKVLEESVKNGILLQSNLDALEAEEMKSQQNLAEATESLSAMYQTFTMYTARTIDDKTMLSTDPAGGTSSSSEITRPEIKFFSLQKDLLDRRYKLTNKAAYPRLSIFGEAVYGRPGYNFLDQNMRFFGKAGIALKWNISPLYNLNKEKQSLNISKQMVDVQREVFEFNVRTALNQQNAQINSLRMMLETDKQIIEKRKNIKATASAQFENGSITSTDYLTELNAEMQAELNQKIHEIRLMNAITSLNITKGITNF